ncbi:MAG: phenylacetic acid degradation operon negative regulatory protein [Parcubacteria group bacterium Gr01-1014_29]|nr:MAG: phenylacetic acid degradation operon negative regulatory protein [Parcubacteria group bacterium Gr01-1014_29]
MSDLIKIKKRSHVPYQKIIIETIALAGIISMAVLAPNALQSLSLFGYGKRGISRRNLQTVRSTVYRLQKEGIVDAEEQEGDIQVSLTKAGERKLAYYRAHTLKEEFVPKQWDGKWRMVVFDIAERKRKRRDWLRRELWQVGFVRLQNSVWITPYPCEEFISLLKVDGKLGVSTLFAMVEKVEGDQWLKKRFQLVQE